MGWRRKKEDDQDMVLLKGNHSHRLLMDRDYASRLGSTKQKKRKRERGKDRKQRKKQWNPPRGPYTIHARDIPTTRPTEETPKEEEKSQKRRPVGKARPPAIQKV